MYLARYPNVNSTTQWEWLNINDTCVDSNETGKKDDPCITSFTAYDSHFQYWTEASDLWMHGYWNLDWADNHIKISNFKVSGDQATFYADKSTPPLLGFRKNARFYAENLLEELDTTDEYYIDRIKGVLYVSVEYKDILAETQFVVSKGPNVIQFGDGAKNIEINSLNLAYAKQILAISDYPDAIISDVTFKNCDFTGSGNGALGLRGKRVTILKNTVHNMGCMGFSISGGDRSTLESSEIMCTENSITDFSLWKRTYTPGIKFGGVGVVVSSNLIYGGPHQGISGTGNNHIFEKNYLSDLCLEVGDSGAFYVGKSWSNRGCIVRENTFENVRPTRPIELGNPWDYGVYLDDQMAGYEIYNNTFINNYRGVSLGGGRDNHIHDNIFINCDMGVWFDDRGETWQQEPCPPGGSFEQDLDSFFYKDDPWASAYPEVVNTFDELPCTPQHNRIVDNMYCKLSEVFIQPYEGWDQPESDNTIQNNTEFIDC